MIVIVPYQDDKHNGVELKYSIRSLVKHFRAMTGLVLVGDLPRWYKGDFIKMLDVPARREYSMYVKAMAGAKAFNLETFLYTTDDHFALKDFDETLPNYYNGVCRATAKAHRSARFRRMYANCIEGWLNYDCHIPIVMKQFWYDSRRLETDTPIKSTYANKAGLIGTPSNDLKIHTPICYDCIKRAIDGKSWFSTSPYSQNGEMMRILQELYPNKSIYEK